MKPYKSIQTYNVSTVEDETGNLINIIVIGEDSFIGIIKLNEHFVSTIVDRVVNISVQEDKVDDFLCFFLKNRIVLTEKTRRKIKFKDLIKKKYWLNTHLIEYEYADFFIFKNVDVNFITMNNNVEILIPLFVKN